MPHSGPSDDPSAHVESLWLIGKESHLRSEIVLENGDVALSAKETEHVGVGPVGRPVGRVG